MNFGDKVKITEKLKRTYVDGKCFWEPIPFEADGIYLGTRRLSNGTIDTDGSNYQNTQYFTVMFIAPALNRNPIYVLAKDQIL